MSCYIHACVVRAVPAILRCDWSREACDGHTTYTERKCCILFRRIHSSFSCQKHSNLGVFCTKYTRTGAIDKTQQVAYKYGRYTPLQQEFRANFLAIVAIELRARAHYICVQTRTHDVSISLSLNLSKLQFRV